LQLFYELFGLRTIPDGMMLLGGGIIFYDLVQKTFFAKKHATNA